MSARPTLRSLVLAVFATAALLACFVQCTASAQAATTIFGTATPATADSKDPTAVVLGVKFSSEVPGTITGIRFYKATANTGTHVASLWSSSGTLLASATVTGESASGWQLLTFSTPVTISANTTYVASYLAPKGHYSETLSGFATAGASSPPLTALANTASANGVYVYSATNAFPTHTYKATNYWVDVLFEAAHPTAPGPVGNVTAQAGANSATVSWSAPTSGGAPTEYKITPYISGEAQPSTVLTGSPPATATTLTGLKGATPYSFTVQPLNAAGAGPVSSPSNTVTPFTPAPPEAPTEVSATAGNASAAVKWTAPGNGGSAILSYTITPYVESEALPSTTVKGTPPATAITIEGLTNATTYTFRVAATNQYGTGPESSPSNVAVPSETIAEPGILMGAEQKAHWQGKVSECKSGGGQCSDEISQGQFVAWPFVAEHTGTIEAVFAVLAGSRGGTNTGAEIGIYGNRIYQFPEIKYNNASENSKGGCSCTWTPVEFMAFEAEIPPEDPGPLLATSGKVAESKITNEQFTEFKLERPIRVFKGVKYWLANTTFQKAESTHVYQKFVHERASLTEGQPWGVYSNEPSNWWEAPRPLKELPSPEATKINCEQCNTEGWLQEEPAGKHLTNSNREAQEEGGQTLSYAYGKIEEGAPNTVPGNVGSVTAQGGANSATVRWSAPAGGGEATEYRVTPYTSGEAQASTAVTGSPPATSATVTGLTGGAAYTFTVQAINAVGPGPASAPSNEVVPFTPTAPEAPTEVTASAGNASANVRWTAPGSGGSAILTYTVTPYAGTEALPATTVKGTPPATTATIEGLKNATTYTFRVAAANQYGTGPESSPSNAATPTAPTGGGNPVLDPSANATVNGKGTVTTPLFTTSEAGERLFAFVSTDGPSGAARQTVTVTGAGLSWTLVKRANTRAGDAEIWTATALAPLFNVSATATPSATGFDQSLTVVGVQMSQGRGVCGLRGGEWRRERAREDDRSGLAGVRRGARLDERDRAYARIGTDPAAPISRHLRRRHHLDAVHRRRHGRCRRNGHDE